jgi:hypothetical protein
MNNTEQMPWIYNSNNTIIHLEQTVDMFNKYCSTLIDRMKLDYIHIGNATSFLRALFPMVFQKLEIITNHRSRTTEQNFLIEFSTFIWIW